MNVDDYRKQGFELAKQYLDDLEQNTDPYFTNFIRFNLASAINMAGYSNIEDFKKELARLT